MKKRIILIFGLLIITIVSVLAVTVFADTENEDPTLTIKSNTLELENAVFMNYKIDANGIEDESCVKLLVWESAPAEYTKESAEGELSSIRTEEDTGYLVFQYDDLAAKDMTKFVYVCAYAEIDGIEIYSKPVKFSIVQYAYNMLNSDNVPEYLEGILTNMLEYGAFSQLYFEHNTDFLATDEVAKIKVVNGTHADGFKTGYYKAGTSVTITANEAEEGYVFSHWTNSAGEEVGTETTLTIPECVTETYTAVYEEAVKYSEGLAFTSNGDGTCYVSGIGTCTDTDIVIPSMSPDGDDVVKIGAYAFSTCSNLESVILPNTVKRIEKEAFSWCSNLKKVILSENLEFIRQYAFLRCSNLSVISIPEKVTYISEGAFRECSSIVSLTIPDGVTTVHDYTFYGCSNLTEVIISNNVTVIRSNAFSGCWNLSNLVLPIQLAYIGNYAFQYCFSINEIAIPNTISVINDGVFQGCTNMRCITIPNSVRTIKGRAFQDCTNLVTVNYGGSEEQWAQISIDSSNSKLNDADINYNYITE